MKVAFQAGYIRSESGFSNSKGIIDPILVMDMLEWSYKIKMLIATDIFKVEK